MRFFLMVLIVLSVYALKAQQVRVVGKSDIQPIINCLIYNQDKSISVSTNQEGKADLSKFKESDKLTFSHVAYQSRDINKSFFKAGITEIVLTELVINLKEVVLSANKVEEQYVDLPLRIDIIQSRQIQFGNPQTSAELLQQHGTVFVQQSQLGGGSPVLRGMESSRVLLVVDGVRLNNAIYRSGHLQNAITVDPNILSRVEVLHGPGSVIYGSDAMGGVVHFYTRNPVLSANGKLFSSGNAMLRFASASNEFTQSFSVNLGGKKLAAFIGATNKKIGDLRQGSKRISKYGDWGKCLFFAERINGNDEMVENEDPLIQKNSGYSQYDIFGKVLFKQTNKVSWLLNTQFSNSSDIPRYDRLTEMSSGKLKYAEWYYGPQTRGLVSMTGDFTVQSSWFDSFKVLAAYQYISEDRVSRSFGKSKKRFQEETVNIMSFNADFFKHFRTKSELRYGVEAIANRVASKAYNKNILTNAITNDATSRYPDAGSRMSNFSAYASNNWEISEKVIFSQGLRFNYVDLFAEYTSQMMDLIKFPFAPEMKQDNTALNGSLGLVYMPGKDWRLTTNISTGFRAPNIDDLSKINDSNSSDQLVIVPNPDLKPEHALNTELTIGKTFNDVFQFEVTGFFTQLRDAFVARPFKYNGLDSIVFDGNLSAVQALQNTDKAIVIGAEANVLAKIYNSLSIRSSITYTYGRVTTEDVPLDHIPPLFGITTLKYSLQQFNVEFYSRYNGWKRIADYSPSGEDNEKYATEDGMPAWYTLNLKAGYQINRYLALQAGMENIMDVHYRYFASGISAPGRNLIFTLRGTF